MNLAAESGQGDLPRVYAGYLKWTVPLWLMGVLIPAAVFVLVKLVMEKWPRGRAINLVVFAWLSIGLSQAICSILNGLMLGDPLLGLRNSLSFTVIGWVFGALAIAAGSAWNLANQRVARLVAYLGGYILVLAVIAVMARLAGLGGLSMPTPLGLLLPGGNAARFYTSMVIFQREETFGEATTRLILFFPWATALGLGGIAITLISSRVKNLRWRGLGMAGGLVGTVFSWSRLAIAAIVLVGAFLIFLKLPRAWQILCLFMAAVAFALLPVFGLDVISLITDAHHAADSARAGSSLARDLIYEKSWEGFLTSPIIGNGWIGASVHRIEELPIGSHSTVYGLLYTGGIATMACFVTAMLMTLGAVLVGLYRQRGNKEAFDNGLVGLCLLITILLFCPYESLFSLTLPVIYLFAWIGGGIPETSARSIPVAQEEDRPRFGHGPKTSTALAIRPPKGGRFRGRNQAPKFMKKFQF
jgi:hypothetical protein